MISNNQYLSISVAFNGACHRTLVVSKPENNSSFTDKNIEGSSKESQIINNQRTTEA
tara:strand:- start:317 stop:487 length:171 start_codon:yes stop_codon:yes gene_type:complete